MAKEAGLPLALAIIVAPTACMMIGSMLVLCVRFTKQFQASMQLFSAGILIAAIGNELFPLLNNGVEGKQVPTDMESYVGVISGFAIGLFFMFGIDMVVDTFGGEEEEEENEGGEAPLLEDEDTEENALSAQPQQQGGWGRVAKKYAKDAQSRMRNALEQQQEMDNSLASLKSALEAGGDEDEMDEASHHFMFVIDKARRSLLPKAPLNEDAKQEMQTHIEDLRKQISLFKEQRTRAGVRASLKTISDMLKHIHDEHVDERFSRWKIKPVPHEDAALSENIPWATVFAVIVDSGVDGVLIGLALAAKEAAGISMAIATCIEMGFLGLSFSATIQNSTRSVWKHIGIVMVPPLVILGAGVAGHEAGSALQSSQGVFIAFIAFAIVALLFLVTQELLKEAGEVAGESIVINMMFFIGLLGGIILDKVLG